MQVDPGFASLRYTASLYFLTGELDLATSDALEALLDHALADQGPVILDLTGVTFMDSTAIGAIIHAIQRAPKGCVILHGVRDSVRRAMTLMDLDAMPGIHVNGCDRDPYPTGRALLGPEGSQELVRGLAEMATRHRMT